MAKYFTRHATGGVITSKVDQQDSVAIHVALTLISGHSLWGISFTDSPTLEFEQIEDLHLTTPQARVGISVKYSELSPSEFDDEIARLRQLVPSTFSHTVLASINGGSSSFRSMQHKLNELSGLLADKAPSQRNDIETEFRMKNSFPYGAVSLLDAPDLDGILFKAHVARLLRQCAPIADYSDARVDAFTSFLTGRFGEARRNRQSVPVMDVQTWLVDCFANPIEAILFEGLPYVGAPDKGYIRDATKLKRLEELSSQVQAAHRKLLRSFRAAHRGTAAKWILYRGAPPCPNCGHPLMANWLGLGPRGIACPDCGYTPYVTLFYVCRFSHATLLLEQPNLSDFASFNVERIRALREFKCKRCGAEAVMEEALQRLVQLNAPARDWKNLDRTLRDLPSIKSD